MIILLLVVIVALLCGVPILQILSWFIFLGCLMSVVLMVLGPFLRDNKMFDSKIKERGVYTNPNTPNVFYKVTKTDKEFVLPINSKSLERFLNLIIFTLAVIFQVRDEKS